MVTMTAQIYKDFMFVDGKEESFEKLRIDTIESDLKIYAATKAIALQTRLILEESFPESPSGTIPAIECNTGIGPELLFSSFGKKSDIFLNETPRGREFGKIQIDYTEPNGNYQNKRSI